MNKIHIQGGIPLRGEVRIQGSKNAVLPILAATVLIKGICVIQNCPHISDVDDMIKILQSIGCEVSFSNTEIVVNAVHIYESRLPREYVTGMRSSIILMGALLARMGEVQLDHPGGCVIGDRPIDIHVSALKQLGVQIEEKDGILYASTGGMLGTEIRLRFPSVGATENIILAAVQAKGITKIYNCAQEPEIKALCEFLIKAGAKITGMETGCLTIAGVTELKPVEYEMDSDRIVAGTYLFSTTAWESDITLLDAPVAYMKAAIKTARQAGLIVTVYEHALRVRKTGPLHAVSYIETAVYPGFPTDLQSVLLVMLSMAEGNSVLKENIFNRRFGVAAELNRMGAAIDTQKENALIQGNRQLSGRHVIAEDLRGGAALIAAGLAAGGDTFVSNIGYIERGYEDICRDYRMLGADIRRCSEEAEKEKEE